MIFWTVAGLLALVALAAVTVPVLRGRAEARRAADYDIEVYRDQLAEVERNQKRGTIGAAEAEAAKAEIGRRILAADQRRTRADSAGEGGSKGLIRAAAVVVGLAIPVGAVAVYLSVGRPGLESMPLASRDIAAEQQTAQRGNGGQRDGGGQGGANSLAEAEAQLAKKLEEQPQNREGWILLGRTRQQMGKPGAAAEAFQRARELAPGDPQVQAMYGEALVMANQGTVTPKARDAFEAVLEQRPDDPRSRFYLGLAAQQAGQPQEALERWTALVADAEPGAAYLDAVGQQMAQVEQELGIEPGTTFAEVKPEATGQADQDGGSGQGAAQSGPTQEQMQQAQEMSPEQQQEMIRGMVDRLAGRLEENPDDLQGWLQLARSYEVLEQPAQAVEAYAKAAELAPQDPEVLRRYARALRAEAGGPSEDSITVTRRLLEVQPENAEALWFTALAELSEGDKERARELFDQALAQLPPDTPQTAELRKRADELLQEN